MGHDPNDAPFRVYLSSVD